MTIWRWFFKEVIKVEGGPSSDTNPVGLGIVQEALKTQTGAEKDHGGHRETDRAVCKSRRGVAGGTSPVCCVSRPSAVLCYGRPSDLSQTPDITGPSVF